MLADMTTNEPPSDPFSSTRDLPAYGSTPPPEGGYPPPPGPTPPSPVGGNTPYNAPDAIGYGWRKFQENAGPMVLATLLVVSVTIALAIIAEVVAPMPGMVAYDGSFDFDGDGFFTSLVVQTLIGAVTYFFFAMLTRGALDVVDARKFNMGAAFAPLKFPKIVLTGIVLSVLSTIGFLLFVIPGLVFTVFSFFTIYFVIDKDEDPIQAVQSSFKLVGANFGQSLLSGLLAFLVLMAGAILCLVGLLAAIPIVTIAGAYAYRRFQNQPVAP